MNDLDRLLTVVSCFHLAKEHRGVEPRVLFFKLCRYRY